MKSSRFSKFFGNRFAAKRTNLLGRLRRKSCVAERLAGEFEILESRILLSGIGTGVDQKRVQFTDADGDLVTVSARGEGASFDIMLVGGVDDGADIESITIKGQGASLGIAVTPQGFETGEITPGFSNVGQISASKDVTQLGSISLSAAVASKIDLGSAEVGSISLTTGQTAKVDALTGGGFEGAPSLDQISFHEISTGSVGALRLSGGTGGTNNFQAEIAATIGDIGQLWGPNSTMFGNLHFGGADAALGSVNLGGGFYYGAQITAAGNFTFLADGFDGTITVDGHLNLGVGAKGIYGAISAGDGVSGLKASTTDAVVIGGIFSADLSTVGDIADVKLSGGGYLNDAIIEAVNIGTISGRSDGSGIGYGNIFRASGDLEGIELRRSGLGYGNVIDVSGQIGEIDIVYGSIDGLIMAGSFGQVRVSHGSIYGSLVALSGDIGSVEVLEGSIYGSIQALQGGIGSISAVTSQNYSAISGKISALFIGPVSATNLGDGFAIGGSGMQIFANDDIAGITTITNGATAFGDYASVQAGGALGVIHVTALSIYSYDSAAISNAYVQADSIGAITVASSTGQGIAYSEFVAVGGDIGPIAVTSRTGGILNSEFKAYKGSIGDLSIVNVGPGDTSLPSAAVGYSNFQAAGNIGSIEIISAGRGFYYSSFTSEASIGDISLDAVAEGAYRSHFAAQDSIGNVSFVSRGSRDASGYTAISTSSFEAHTGAIGNVSVTSAGQTSDYSRGQGINFSLFKAATSIGDVAVSSGGRYSPAIASSSFSVAQGDLGDITVVSATGAGIYESDFTAAGKIGNVTVEAGATAIGGMSGYNYGSRFTAGGSIGNISAISVGIEWVGPYSAIYNTVFEVKSNIGNITAVSAGDGIAATRFLAGGNIGDVSAIAKGNLYDGMHATAISAGFVAQGSIGNIAATSYAGIGINFALIEAGLDIGNVTVLGLGGEWDTAGMAAVQYSSFRAKAGSIGTIDVTSIDKAVYTANFSAYANIGDISLRANSEGPMEPANHTVAEQATFSAETGNIGHIVLTSKLGAGALYSNFSAGGDIASVEIEAATVGMSYSGISSGGNIGSVSVTSQGLVYYGGAYTAVAYSGVSAIGSIGSITVRSFGTGIYESNFSAGGDIGGIDVQAAHLGVAGMSGYNSGSSFTAAGSIESISVISAGQYGSGYTAVLNADFNAGAEIGSINVQSAGEGMRYASFASGGNIGSVSVTSQGFAYYGGTYTALSYSSVSAKGAIGGISVNSAGAGVYESNFSAGGDIGYIDVQAAGTAIGGLSGYGSSFTAGAFIGGISVVSTGANGIGYAAIYNAAFGSGVHIGNISVESAGDGMRNTSIVAGGGIGNMSVTSQTLNPYGGSYTAVAYSSVSAYEGIQGVMVDSSGAGIYESFFSAGSDIGSIHVFASEVAVGGIAGYGSLFVAGGSIGGINVGSASAGYAAVYNATFAAVAEIGDVQVDSAGDGLRNATLTSFEGSIGEISVFTNALYAYGASYTAVANSTVSAALGIGSIVVGSSGAGIYESSFTAGWDIGLINVAATDVAIGGALGYGSSFTAGGWIGGIDVASTGADYSGFTAVYNADFSANYHIDSINISSLGEGMRNASFAAGTELGNVSVVSLGLPYGGSYTAVVDSSFTSKGSIGAVSVTSAGDGMHAARFEAPIGIIDSVGIKAGATGIIDSSFSAGAAIGNVSVTAAGDGIASASFNSGIISDITINSSSNSRLTLNAAIVGTVSATGSAFDWATVTLDLGPDTRVLGAVTADANLEIVGDFAALENLGAVTVGGNILLNTSLASVQTASTITAASILGGQTIGTGLAGSSIGLVTITNGDVAANSVTFNFASMNGVSAATANASVVVDFLNGAEPDITALGASLPGGQSSAGVTAILV